MKSSSTLDLLQRKINYSFRHVSLLEQALKHSSQAEKNAINHFERLEFLGDRVVGLCLAQALYQKNPKDKEGQLAKRFSYLASREVMSKIAHEIDLATYLIVARNEDLQKTCNSTVLADALEALVGAVFMDGGFEAGHQVFHKLWSNKFENDAGIAALESKSTLQEWTQAHGLELPDYQVLDVSGPDHDPIHQVQVTVDGWSAQAVGASKKSAEQAAAQKLYAQLIKRNS